MSELIHFFTPYAQEHVSEMHDTDLTYVTQRLKMSPFSKEMIVHFIGFLNRAHQDEKSDILHVSIFKVFAEI